jgi:DNA-binding CsgD family transcriptional regulator/tetratricopeptide (TPR) repeat protein
MAKSGTVDVASDIERGRELCAEQDWAAAYSCLSAIDPVLLSARDLELLAGSAYMLGRDDAYVDAWELAYHSHLRDGDTARAALCTWWIGDYLRFRGESARATGWFARGDSLLDQVGEDCVARGFLLLPAIHDFVSGHDHEAAFAVAAEAGEIGARFADRDLTALAMMERGHALVRQGRASEGLRLVDETMVAVTTEEPSPVIAGIVYCSTIAFCQAVFELGRAQEWTEAHTAWCERQSDMRAYMGACLVHRAEIMTLAGNWSAAMAEVRRAEGYTQGVLNERVAAEAAYRRGEVHLLRGELDSAEEAYREASRRGREPQPGLALLRLAQGEGEAAAASLRRALGEASHPLRRAALLPAYVEIMLAVDDLEEALAGCRDLEDVAELQASRALAAMADYARGAVDLVDGNARTALVALRRACRAWQELGVPREIARTRLLVGQACAALGDPDTAGMEREAARDTFEKLGATPELTRIASLGNGPGNQDAHGLTTRELQILRVLATGKSNREIAAALVISDHTVRRHIQNIFVKLGVSSRAAATAFAYRHDLT